MVFNSKKDYYKLNDIERMIKKYFKIERKYTDTEKKYFINYYLKLMMKKLEEYEEMEVFSDHVEAFPMEFSYISDFISNRMILKLPQKALVIGETNEDFIEEMLKTDEEYYRVKYGENEKYYRNIEKVMDLLLKKILF